MKHKIENKSIFYYNNSTMINITALANTVNRLTSPGAVYS